MQAVLIKVDLLLRLYRDERAQHDLLCQGVAEIELFRQIGGVAPKWHIEEDQRKEKHNEADCDKEPDEQSSGNDGKARRIRASALLSSHYNGL